MSYTNLTGGRYDTAISKVFTPPTRIIAPFFGNFLLARIILYLSILPSVISAAFIRHDLLTGSLTAVINALFAWWVNRMIIEPLEKEVAKMDEKDLLSLGLILQLHSIWRVRVMWFFAFFVIDAIVSFSGSTPFHIWITDFCLIWSMYATTYIRPRRKLKTVARVRAWAQQTRTRLSPAGLGT